MVDPLRVITQTESWSAEVKADVVDELRGLLASAEAGEIQGIAYAAIGVDGCVTTGATKNVNQSSIIGGLERIKHRMLASE